MTKILSAILASFTALNPLATAALAAITAAIGFFNFMNGVWATLLAKMALITLPANVAVSVMTGFSFVNYVFPMEELFTFTSAYMTLVGVCAVVRIVKSFIPTIS